MPELRRQRIVLYRQDSRRGQLVAAVSPLATRDGIGVGMPLSEAKSLLKRNNGDFHVFEHDPAADLAAIEKLADSLETFSPLVGLEEIETAKQKKGQQPSSIFLDVTGLAHLFGDEHQLAHQLFLHCEQLGYLATCRDRQHRGRGLGHGKIFSSRAPATPGCCANRDSCRACASGWQETVYRQRSKQYCHPVTL